MIYQFFQMFFRIQKKKYIPYLTDRTLFNILEWTSRDFFLRFIYKGRKYPNNFNWKNHKFQLEIENLHLNLDLNFQNNHKLLYNRRRIWNLCEALHFLGRIFLGKYII